MPQTVLNSSALVLRRRLQTLTLATVAVLVVGLIVAVSLYKFIGGAIHTFSADVQDVNQQTAFAFGLLMPLLSYGAFRRANFLAILSVQLAAAAVWVVLLVGAFLPQGNPLALVSIVLVCGYLLAIAGLNLLFSFTVSWLVKSLYAAVAVLCSGAALGIYAAGLKDVTAVYVTAAGMLGAVLLIGTATFLNRSVEVETANAAVFGSRLPSVFYFWGGTLYFGVAVFALPLTILIDRPFPFEQVSVASYVVLGVSGLLAIVLVVLIRLQRISPLLYSLLYVANTIAACAASLLINDKRVFLESADSLLLLGIYLIAVFLLAMSFSPSIMVSKGYAVVRNALSWYSAACLGIIVMLISTHSENLLASSFMPLDTFIIFLFLLGAGAQFGALLVMYGAALRSVHTSPRPLSSPNKRVVEE